MKRNSFVSMILGLCVAVSISMFGCNESDIASSCSIENLEGTWLLENQSTWNEITLDSFGTVIAGRHPHGVLSISGSFTITKDCLVDGLYIIQDEDSLENDSPTPPGIWSVIMNGYMKSGKESMELNYILEYTPQGEKTETYTGIWYATKQ